MGKPTPAAGFTTPVVAVYPMVLMAVVNWLLSTLNASNISKPFTRSVKGSVRVRRPFTVYWLVPKLRVPTPTNGARSQPPEAFSELVYVIVMPENCWLPAISSGVRCCGDASVAIPETSHPFSRNRAKGALLLITVGCHSQFTVPRCRWSAGELPRSPAESPGLVFAGTPGTIGVPLTSSMACDHVYDACTLSVRANCLRNWTATASYQEDPPFSNW